MLRTVLRITAFSTFFLAALMLGLPLYLAGFGTVSLGAGAPSPPQAGEADPLLQPLAADHVWDLPVRVYDPVTDTVTTMNLEAYVAGVVAAEMPAHFHPEALKAQAVAARTYAVRRLRVLGGGGCPQRPDADVCRDPALQQAFMDAAEGETRWGEDHERLQARIDEAVAATRGLILVYDGQPIDAVYHSTSGGFTADAADVWRQAAPYLQAVASPYEQASPRLTQQVELPLTELAERLALPLELVKAAAEAGTLLQAERDPYGRITALRVAGRDVEPALVRERLGLNSTWFYWQYDEQRVRFDVRGYGHGVGMSQYGAEGMAQNGATFDEILAHYYRGAELRPIFIE